MPVNVTHKKVFVGLSGGVDSSVAAKRLIGDGYEVTGVFIKTWQPDFLRCHWEEERLDAMRVAAKLEIPMVTFDAEDVYRKQVADYIIHEYSIGRTPNPDVMCNKFVKFGTFLDFAANQNATVATGHYAQISNVGGIYTLRRGVDISKDQSYFLWTLTQEQLSKIHFPVGNSHKCDVRSEAKTAGLPTYVKRDSQGICFLGDIDMKEFISHYVSPIKGIVLDESGNNIGEHDGAILYTYGERHGFTVHTTSIHSEPYYVVHKDLAQNTITVSRLKKMVSLDKIFLTSINLMYDDLPRKCEAQFRYRQTPFKILCEKVKGGRVMLSVNDKGVDMPSTGQSCVFYDGDICLGGGIIDTE